MQRFGEVDDLAVGEVTEASDAVLAGAHMDLQRPAGGERHGDGERVVGDDRALGVLGDKRAAQASALALTVRRVLGELGPDGGREVTEGVDLAVHMVEGGADFGTTVLERHHVVEALVPQLTGALAQHGDEVDELAARQLGQRAAGVVRRVHDDLTATADPALRAPATVGASGDSDGNRLSNTAMAKDHGNSAPPGQSGHGPSPVAAVLPPGRRLRAGEISTQAPVSRSKRRCSEDGRRDRRPADRRASRRVDSRR